MSVGIWANVNGRNYVEIVDNASRFTEVSVLIIVVGLFVLLVGIVGTVGAIFAHYLVGRITLVLVRRKRDRLWDCEFILLFCSMLSF